MKKRIKELENNHRLEEEESLESSVPTYKSLLFNSLEEKTVDDENDFDKKSSSEEDPDRTLDSQWESSRIFNLKKGSIPDITWNQVLEKQLREKNAS